MGRPLTMFSGQWADMKLEELAPLAAKMGYEGLELALTQNHIDMTKADDDSYLKERWDILASNNLNCYALSNHLVGQCVCDNIDSRHRAIMQDYIWGDGDPEGVRTRAAEEMKKTARFAKKFFAMRPKSLADSPIPPTVTGFTGSSIWQYLYSFPPVSFETGGKEYRYCHILSRRFQKKPYRLDMTISPSVGSPYSTNSTQTG